MVAREKRNNSKTRITQILLLWTHTLSKPIPSWDKRDFAQYLGAVRGGLVRPAWLTCENKVLARVMSRTDG